MFFSIKCSACRNIKTKFFQAFLCFIGMVIAASIATFSASAYCAEDEHVWGNGNVYAASICTVCNYCKHSAGTSGVVYKYIDDYYHSYGEQCYACFKAVSPILGTHKWITDETGTYCEDCFTTKEKLAIKITCNYCGHVFESVEGSDSYFKTDNYYHAYGTKCPSCSEIVNPILGTHSWVGKQCEFCFAKKPETSKYDTKGEETIANFLDKVFSIVRGVGVILLVWGFVLLALAVKSEDADSKTKATLFIVVAIVLCFIGALFGPIFETIGYNVPS